MTDHTLPDWHSTFSAHVEAGTDTVHARGSLDLLTLELLRGTVEILIHAGHLDVTVDLSGLTAIDHAGLLMLGGLREDLDYRGGSLTLSGAAGTVRSALAGAALPVAGLAEASS